MPRRHTVEASISQLDSPIPSFDLGRSEFKQNRAEHVPEFTHRLSLCKELRYMSLLVSMTCRMLPISNASRHTSLDYRAFFEPNNIYVVSM